MHRPAITDDAATLCAVGVTVAITGSLSHEVLGHGLACAAEGGSITLLTFLVFRCVGAGALTDGAGPIGALMAGLLCLVILALARPKGAIARLFLLTFGAVALLWVFGQMLREAVDQTNDWGHVARDLRWAPVWRPVLGCIGAIGYGAVLRQTARFGRGIGDGRPARLLLPCLAAAGSAVILGLLWHGDRVGSALDGLLTFGLAPVGYLLSIPAMTGGRSSASGPIGRSWAWIGGAAILFAAFALTIARGAGPLA